MMAVQTDGIDYWLAVQRPLFPALMNIEGDTMNNMKVIAKRDDVLTALRTNREEHQQILKEARAGYVQKAREALSKRLDQLASGKLLALHFDLVLPSDYTKEYDAAIRMLELHQEDTVTLDESMVRCLVLNEWGWMSGFLTSNSAYSNTARSKLSE